MKNIYLLLLFIATFSYAQQQPFITTWQVQGENLTIYLPLYNTETSNLDYTVDFGDGTVLLNQATSVAHEYAQAGIYTVTISGTVPWISFGQYSPGIGLQSNASKIRTVEQWGDISWKSMVGAFQFCSNLVINTTDAPDLSQVTDLTRMFLGCSSLNQTLNNWDVSNVTKMQHLFSQAYSFNQPLNNWDVSNVTNMVGVFNQCDSYNQPLNSWNVGNAINMSNMFSNAKSFNQSLDGWDVSNAINMSQMFSGAETFNQSLDNWDVSNVTNMVGMFSEARNFNQPLNSWDVSNVTEMHTMFAGAEDFNQPLDNWNVSNVTNISSMFSSAESFNQPLNNWNVSNVTDMTGLFWNAASFNQPIDNWDVSNVTLMMWTFENAASFNQPLNNWDVSNVTEMHTMFNNAVSFNQPLNNWNVSNVTNMYRIFSGASAFNQDLSSWDFSSVIESIWVNNTNLSTYNYDALLNRFVQQGLQNYILRADDLQYCNIGIRNYLIENLGWTITDDGLGEDCQGNNVTGTMLIDTNLNGCEATDAPAVNFMVQATNGSYNYGTFVNATGNYDLRVQEDTYTVSPVNIPEYFTVSPASAELSFTGFGNSEALNFCLVPNQSVQDLNITVLPIGDARPGFESDYKILVENIGTQSVTNATVTLTFDTTLQSFVSAVPAPTGTTNNQPTFTLTDLGVFETKEVNLTMTTFQPPVVNGGEVATFTANVTPDAGDNTPNDNIFILNQTIVNSYDPNDKRVAQGDAIFMEQTGEYLDYIIRFQNTGTASAITVRVEDTLSDNLDWTTLKPIAASHAYRVEVTEGNKVNFIFDNINLPHEAADAPGSNGYIAYKVKPKQGIQLGDVIAGNAGIYFDFNLPIITNTVTTTVVEPLGVKQNAKTAVSIYPNPAGDVVHLQTHPGTQVQQAVIYNLQGSELMSVSQNQNMETLNISSLSAGVYLLQVQTNTGRATYRLVKK